jgi:D-inositol-3-phosphate glycosyltransferase
MTALESMYFGTPVIASRTGGLIDLVGGDSGGVLLSSFDPSEWATAIEAMLSRRDDRREDARNAARTRAAGLTWDALRSRYAAFYERVVAECPQPRRVF